MKTRVFLLLLCCATPLAADYGPPVLETADEFFAYGDFNANGLRSLVVIDRASGGMRSANATALGGLIMAEALPSAVTGVTGVAVGRFKFSNRDALAVTNPETNRVKLVGQNGALTDAWPVGVGPRDLAALPVPGSSSGLHGLAAITALNPAKGGTYRRNLMKNTSGTLVSWVVQTPTLSQSPQRVLAVVRQPGDTARYGELRANGTDRVFAVHDSQNIALPTLTSCAGVVDGSAVCYGHFNPGHNRSVLVFHLPGSQSIQVSAFDSSLNLSAPATHNLGTALAWVYPAPAEVGLRLIGCDATGANLRVLRFGTTNVPSLVQTLPAPKGRIWKGLTPAPDGGWFAATGLPGGTETLTLQRFTYQGAPLDRFAAGTAYEMKPLRTEELGGDVLLFAGRPFLDNNPVMRGKIRAGGWTSDLSVGPSPSGQIAGIRETWRGASVGLGLPGTAYLGFTPAGVTHGLANQLSAETSCYSLDPPVGLLPDAILFDPPPGPQAAAVTVTLTANNPTTAVYYALGTSTAWSLCSGPLGPYSATTTIRAYAGDGTTQTPISSATYTFPDYPGDVDSDGDGVPDFVESQYGLHPVDSLGDSDMDGVSDLMEILAGSNPADENDIPEPSQILPYTRRFDLSVEPLSHSGIPHGAPLTLLPCLDPVFPSPTAEPTRVTLCRPDGSPELEGMARTQSPSGGVALVASQRVVPNPPLFWVACTPDRFMIKTGIGTDPRHGRGVFRLLDHSPPPLDPLPKPTLSGSAAQQTAQWTSAMRAHFLANSLVTTGGTASYLETLDLLLAERALGVIFHQRGLIPDQKVTLTPSRGDATQGRHPAEDRWLADLPLATAADTGYDWTTLLAFIRSGNAGIWPRSYLDLVAREFYRIGYRAFEDPDNPLNLAPLDALREYLDTGTVPPTYEPYMTTFPSNVLAYAALYRTAFLASLPQREHTPTAITLTAASGFDRHPWLVLTSSGATEYWLAAPDGTPYPSPQGFQILPGSRYLVSGHLADRVGGGRLLLVDSITFLDAPTLPPDDSDNNLLADSWEAFLYGTLGNNPFADTDGDGYDSLQEMFEWTDPDYPSNVPAVPIVDLRPTHLFIEDLGSRNYLLSWQWPTYYQNRIGFFINGTEDFNTYQRIIDQVPGDAQGHYLAPINATTHPPTYFYRAGMKLR